MSEEFRRDWEFRTGYLREASHENYRGALGFANAAIKAVFTLNGGGLIAFPAYISLFNVKPDRGIITAGIVFVVGLVCAVGASFFGYWSAMKVSEHHENRVEVESAKNEGKSQTDINTLTDLADEMIRRGDQFRIAAVLFGVGGVIAFIGGAGIAWYSIIGA